MRARITCGVIGRALPLRYNLNPAPLTKQPTTNAPTANIGDLAPDSGHGDLGLDEKDEGGGCARDGEGDARDGLQGDVDLREHRDRVVRGQ